MKGSTYCFCAECNKMVIQEVDYSGRYIGTSTYVKNNLAATPKSFCYVWPGFWSFPGSPMVVLRISDDLLRLQKLFKANR